MKKLTLIIMLCVGAYIYYNNKVKAEGPIKQEVAEQAPQHRAPIVIEGSPLDHLQDAWAELPEQSRQNGVINKTYYTTLSDGSRVRNYSVAYDTRKMVPLWVAYPLHKIYTTPKIDRTDAWAYDDAITVYGEGGYDIIGYEITEPKIEQRFQPNVKAGGFNDGENRKLDRGHMLPSASRYNSWQTNAQTFYATNIFPQNARLNQQNWAEVENGTRASMCADTLYVVVGTLFENSSMFVSRGRAITRPSHCYKLLLRTRNGNSGKAISQITDPDEIMAIGFLYENSAEGNVEPYQAVVSIAEIEARAGIKFYPTLHPSVANSVKNQKNIADWKAFR